MIRSENRQKQIMIIMTAILLASVCCMAQQTEIVDKVIAKVDYSVITLSELMEASAPSVSQIRESFPPDEWEKRISEVRRYILMQMINEHVCVRYARENEIPISDEEVDAAIQNIRDGAGMTDEEEFKRQLAREGLTIDELKENIHRQTAVRKVIRKEVYNKVRVNEMEIRDFYRENSDQYQTQAKVRVAVLMLDDESWGLQSSTRSRDKINEIYQDIMNGADFSAKVKEFSDGPEKENGGDIGFLEKGKALPVIETSAFAMNVGDVSKPLQTDFGWVLVKVLEKHDAGVRDLAEVRDGIEELIRRQKSRDLESEWYEKQRAKTFVQILEY